MDDPALRGLVDYAHSLVDERGDLLGLGVHSGLSFLDKGLDSGLGVQIPHPALARLLNVLDN